jgi:hypothetical protein
MCGAPIGMLKREAWVEDEARSDVQLSMHPGACLDSFKASKRKRHEEGSWSHVYQVPEPGSEQRKKAFAARLAVNGKPVTRVGPR